MADWTNIADSALDPDAPVTSELAYAWRDNPIAIAEGAPGAPKIALKDLVAGGSLEMTITGLADFGGLFAYVHATTTDPGGASISVSLSDNGSTFYGSTVLFPTSDASFTFSIDFASGDFKWCAGLPVGAGSGTISGSSLSVVAVRFSLNNGTFISHVLPNGGYSAS